MLNKHFLLLSMLATVVLLNFVETVIDLKKMFDESNDINIVNVSTISSDQFIASFLNKYTFL